MLKNRATNTPLFVIVFTLVPAEEVDQAEGAEEGQESKTKETSGASKESKDAVDGFVDEGVD